MLVRSPRIVDPAGVEGDLVDTVADRPGAATRAWSSGSVKRIVALRPWRSISSAGAPESRTRPARIATTRSHNASASSSSCVTSSTLTPSRRSRSTAAHTPRRADGSSPWVSSSRITRRGSIQQREDEEQALALSAAQRGERRAARARPARTPREGRRRRRAAPEPNRCTASPTRSRSGSDESCNWLPISGRSRSPWVTGIQPEHAQRSRVGSTEALDALDRRRLARAVGADQPDDLAGAHVEIETVDDRPVAVALAQTSDRDHVGVVHASIVHDRRAERIKPRLELRLHPSVENSGTRRGAGVM